MIDTKLSEQLLKTTSLYIKKLNEMGLFTVRDLLSYYPRAYEDRSQFRQIHEVNIREVNTIKAKLNAIENIITPSRKKVTKAELMDQTGNVIEAVWFNQPYLATTLKNGHEYIFSGRVKLDFGRLTFQGPGYEEVKQEQVHSGRIVPVYTEFDTGPAKKNTIGSDWLRNKMHLIVHLAREEADFLPAAIMQKERLIPRNTALEQIHFPASAEKLEQARHRLAFDELFLLQLEALKRKQDYQSKVNQLGKTIPLKAELVKDFIRQLPFELTDSQRITTFQIFKDMEKAVPMIRLLEGDVGSGKTIVATIVAYHTIKSGYQAALMVPTEVLAQQHFEKIKAQLEPYGIVVEILTGSAKKSWKTFIKERLKDGSIHLIIGTHALLEEDVVFHNLGLVVIDEQHRFGVEQRKKLAAFDYPHVLHMTATPIPRTLALTLYGDQDLSILKEMPKGRVPIVTRVVPENKRMQSYRFIESEIIKGRQVYVICPLIEESDKLQFKAVTEEYNHLKDVFGQYHIGLLHGRLKSAEKESIMRDFAQGKTHLLVSTTVIEVGIDVKNATIMMIEGADHFGLAQLHQLRGRVGRGEAQSYCFLFSENNGEDAMKRLRALEKTNSGFALAELDLELRGAGEIYGTRQSGLPDLRMADLLDVPLIEKTRSYAQELLEQDPGLQHFAVLKNKLLKKEEWIVS